MRRVKDKEPFHWGLNGVCECILKFRRKEGGRKMGACVFHPLL